MIDEYIKTFMYKNMGLVKFKFGQVIEQLPRVIILSGMVGPPQLKLSEIVYIYLFGLFICLYAFSLMCHILTSLS